ncbi:hypothetical protein [Xylophilus sp.]|uniref:hypothetical protein n=1 Tax=Xylophilus sp. TaxID=2653893 RepID=UPI0013B9FD00|nr:hypothetical protein [Xylophilus sp.]KAF1043004.1 MAG: hypothetical protein GAK38_04117 [Xylophilus sp.]
MSATSAGLALLASCWLVLSMAQAAEWRMGGWAGFAAVLALALWLSGDAASRTSIAAVSAWAADAERRLDLSALLLAEALLFGAQAIMTAQAQTLAEASRWWRWLGALPSPSLLLTLFFAQVVVMLSVDGVDFRLLSAGCAVLFPLAFVAGSWGLRRALPDVLMRSGLRLALHAVQVGAGIWLARPAALAAADPLPSAIGVQGLALAAEIATVMGLGWLLQRRSILE